MLLIRTFVGPQKNSSPRGDIGNKSEAVNKIKGTVLDNLLKLMHIKTFVGP